MLQVGPEKPDFWYDRLTPVEDKDKAEIKKSNLREK